MSHIFASLHFLSLYPNRPTPQLFPPSKQWKDKDYNQPQPPSHRPKAKTRANLD